MINIVNSWNKNKKILIFLFVILALFLYSYFSLFNKGGLTKILNTDFLFTIAIYKGPENLIPTENICEDSLPATFLYEPLYNSFIFNKPFNQSLQANILQSNSFPIVISIYSKSEVIDIDLAKQHFIDVLTPYLDHSNSCLGILQLKIFPES
jgi:hypothetical protein